MYQSKDIQYLQEKLSKDLQFPVPNSIRSIFFKPWSTAKMTLLSGDRPREVMEDLVASSSRTQENGRVEVMSSEAPERVRRHKNPLLIATEKSSSLPLEQMLICLKESFKNA